MVEVMMMWQSMSAWYTPTVLFCVANVIIATIFIASNKHPDSNSNSNSNSFTPIARVYSFLDRIKSIKLSSSEESQHQHHPPEPPQLIKTATYSSMSRLAQSIFTSSKHATAVGVTTPPELPNSVSPSQLDSAVKPDEPSQLVRVPSFFDRVKSFKISSSVMKKSRSEVRIGADDDSDDDVDLRRPETARESTRNDDVDAKADDFISRFKQQLNLQRLESLVRYNDMLNRGK